MSAPGSCKTNCLSLHCRQISEVKNELHGQPSSLLARMHVSNYKVTFFPIHLVFLELDIDQPYLDFKILDENNNEIIPRTFYLQLLNKEWVYGQWNQNLSRSKPYRTARTIYHIDYTNCLRLRHIFLMKLKFVNKLPKNETIQYNHRYRRHRANNIDGDHWTNKNWSICQWCWIACWYCLKWN